MNRRSGTGSIVKRCFVHIRFSQITDFKRQAAIYSGKVYRVQNSFVTRLAETDTPLNGTVQRDYLIAQYGFELCRICLIQLDQLWKKFILKSLKLKKN